MSKIWNSLRGKKSKFADPTSSTSNPQKDSSVDILSKVGLQVLAVFGGSPAQAAGLIPFFDVIIGVDESSLFTSDKKEGTKCFVQHLEAHLDKPVSLQVFNTKVLETRQVLLTPTHKWGGRGILGCFVCSTTVLEAKAKCVHVVGVAEDSPVYGVLKAERDYIVGYRHPGELQRKLVESEGTLQMVVREALRCKQGKAMTLFFLVYNSEENSLKEIEVPLPISGKVGVAVACGVAHMISAARSDLVTGSSGASLSRSTFDCVPDKGTNGEEPRIDKLPLFEPSQFLCVIPGTDLPSSSENTKNKESQQHNPISPSAAFHASQLESSKRTLSTLRPLESLSPEPNLNDSPPSFPCHISVMDEKPTACEEYPRYSSTCFSIPPEDSCTQNEGDLKEKEQKEFSDPIHISPSSFGNQSITSVSSSHLGKRDAALNDASHEIPHLIFQSPPPEVSSSAKESSYQAPASLTRCESEGITSISKSPSPHVAERNDAIKSKSAGRLALMDPVQFYLTEPGFIPIAAPPSSLFPLLFNSSEQIPVEVTHGASIVAQQCETVSPIGLDRAQAGPTENQGGSPIQQNADFELPVSHLHPSKENNEVEAAAQNESKTSFPGEVLQSTFSQEKMDENCESMGQRHMEIEEDDTSERKSLEGTCRNTTIPSPLCFPPHNVVMKFKRKI